MIVAFSSEYKARFLQLNAEFVHWLSPLDNKGLDYLLSKTSYQKCMIDPETGQLLGALLAYPHDIDYPDHANLIWLRQNLSEFFYIDRIVIAAEAQGQGVGHALYQDLAVHAQSQGYKNLACEVNTRPDNPGSHMFHQRAGFIAIGKRNIPEKSKAVCYYAKAIN
ncbi:GNAT family N-acetyltransferase [Litorimonas sp. WD9-15]|uniref:GNAT family N-acetyltransferase n=1 Tax=Litorimonas sp. WD9-15 TaxID=3418716 RepID=UPI003D050F39